MEILNNFASIYCFIAFIIGAVFMLAMLSIAAMGKVKEPRNKVRFFVTKDSDYYYRKPPILWIGLPKRGEHAWCQDKNVAPLAINKESFKNFGINIDDYKNLRWEDEPVEVFINLED